MRATGFDKYFVFSGILLGNMATHTQAFTNWKEGSSLLRRPLFLSPNSAPGDVSLLYNR